jgi:hypothetical protein
MGLWNKTIFYVLEIDSVSNVLQIIIGFVTAKTKSDAVVAIIMDISPRSVYPDVTEPQSIGSKIPVATDFKRSHINPLRSLRR